MSQFLTFRTYYLISDTDQSRNWHHQIVRRESIDRLSLGPGAPHVYYHTGDGASIHPDDIGALEEALLNPAQP